MNGIPTETIPYNPWAFTPSTAAHQPVDNTGEADEGPPERKCKSVWSGCRGRTSRRIRNTATGQEYASAAEAAEKLGCSRGGVLQVCNGSLAMIRGNRLEYIR